MGLNYNILNTIYRQVCIDDDMAYIVVTDLTLISHCWISICTPLHTMINLSRIYRISSFLVLSFPLLSQLFLHNFNFFHGIRIYAHSTKERMYQSEDVLGDSVPTSSSVFLVAEYTNQFNLSIKLDEPNYLIWH